MIYKKYYKTWYSRLFTAPSRPTVFFDPDEWFTKVTKIVISQNNFTLLTKRIADEASFPYIGGRKTDTKNSKNRHKECLWFSPNCDKLKTGDICFD